MRDDLLDHARSAEASVTIIFSPLAIRLHHYRDPDPGGWITGLIRYVAEYGGILIVEKDTDEHSNIPAKLTRYLDDLRKDLSGFIYHRDGETSASFRELKVQTLMNQVLLTGIIQSHGEQHDYLNETTLLGRLFSYAVLPSVHDRYDIRLADTHPEENNPAMQVFASTRSPALSGIRLSWIEPGTWASAFSRHLASLPQKQRKRTGVFSPGDPYEGDDVLQARTGQFIASTLIEEINRIYPGRIYDPSSGCGALITLVLRLIRMNKARSGGLDTITSRLIIASDIIHATDTSPVNIAIVRFVIVNWILGGEIRDPSLSYPALWYPFQALSDHVRPGCILYNHDLYEEFVSETAGYPVFRHLHPLDPSDLVPKGEKFSLILTCPAGSLPDASPEIITYLTRRYQSYLKGIHPAPLMGERIQDLISVEGKSIVFIPSSWVSEAPFRGFRRLISQRLPASVIVEEERSGEIDRSGISVVMSGKRGDDRLQVIRLQPAHSGNSFPVRCFSVRSDLLPDDDGWRLDDPWEEEILHRIAGNLMPLAEYIFDEIYPGLSTRGDTRYPGGWTSITCEDGDIRIYQGDAPDPHATAIIPGQDQYLIGLLSSSLITWYVQALFRRAGTNRPDNMSMIKNIPIRTGDPYNEQECQSHSAVEMIISRITMLTRKIRKSHTWHDQNRLNRQITTAEEELDRIVCALYGLTPGDCTEIRNRVAFMSGTGIQITSVHIF